MLLWVLALAAPVAPETTASRLGEALLALDGEAGANWACIARALALGSVPAAQDACQLEAATDAATEGRRQGAPAAFECLGSFSTQHADANGGALPVLTAEAPVLGTTAGAPLAPPRTTGSCFFGFADLFVVEAAVDGIFEVSTSNPGTRYDTALQALGPDCSPIGCNDDTSVTDLRSTMRFELAEGGVAAVLVGGYDGLTGTYNLTMTVTPRGEVAVHPEKEPVQREALGALFSATGGPDWLQSARWGSAEPTCLWYGVSCAADGTITGLELASNGLEGTLPDELYTLDSLQTLSLFDNALRGTLSERIGQLPLEQIELDFTLLEGTIPEAALSSGELLVLWLGSPLLTGTLPPSVTSQTSLQVLGIYDTGISGPLPSEIGNMTALQALYLYGNALTGTLPSSLGALSQLLQIYLDSNFLSGTVPSTFGNLARLEELDLFANQFTGPLPESLGGLSQLAVLTAASNLLSSTLPPSLGGLGRLEQLDLFSNQFTGRVPASFGSLGRLEYLWLFDNLLTSSLPDLGGLARLEQLSVALNLLTGSIPESIGALAQLRQLRLDLNSISGPIPSSLGGLSRLQALSLHSNALTFTIPPELGALTRLRELALHRNALEGSIPGSLGDLGLLETLFLDENALTSTIPTALGALSRLADLFLTSNRLSGSLPPEIGELSRLGRLSLAFNALSSTIPATLGELAQLRELDLGSNLFSGTLPAALAGLNATYAIDVSDNHITGLPLDAWIMPTSDFLPENDPRDRRAQGLFPALSTLRLDDNPLDLATDDFLRVFKAWQGLQVLSCVRCGLYGTLDHLGRPYVPVVEDGTSFVTDGYTSLFQIDVSGNQLSGALPDEPPPSLLVFAASNTGALGAVPSAWLGLALLAVDNTSAAVVDAAWRTETTQSAVPLSFGSFFCRPLVGSGNRVLVTDPSFVHYETCQCAAGHFGHPPDCTPCPPDTFSVAGANTTACTPCPDHSSTLGARGVGRADECLCDAGFVFDAEASACLPCNAGQFGGQSGALSCAVCPVGTFSDRGATECFECPSTGVACAGGTLVAQAGFWRDPPDAAITDETAFLPCSPADVCRVSEDRTSVECASGHTGVMCAECEDGHGRFDNRCFPCWSYSGSLALVVVASALFALLMWLVVRSSARGKSTGSVLLKIVTTHVQCLLVVMRFGWPGPALFDDLAQFLSVATGSDLSLGMLFPLQCAAGTTYYTEQSLVLALPILTIAVAWLVLAVGVVVAKVQTPMAARAQGVLAAIVILFQMHSMVMRRVASFYECEEVAGASRHVEDYGTKCEGTAYTVLLVADIVALIVIVFGVPLAGIWFVRRATEAGRLSNPETVSRIGFLYVGYRLPSAKDSAADASRASAGVGPQRRSVTMQMMPGQLQAEEAGGPVAVAATPFLWANFPTQYWEGVVYSRKLALVGCATFLGPVTRRSLTKVAESDQSAVALLVLLCATMAHCIVQPFDRWQLNALELTSLFALAGTVAGGVAQGRDENFVGVLAGTAHLAFLTGCAGYLAHRIRRRRAVGARPQP